MTADYATFLDRKTSHAPDDGFPMDWVPDGLFPFQRDLTEWACTTGRAALFEDCGMGKTIQQLTWARNAADHTRKPTLVLAPLAVAAQTKREAEKFGLDIHHSRDGEHPDVQIVVTNYERLHRFDPSVYGAVVCDESSILKNFDGATRGEITAFMRHTPYRLLCTATAAPNDYIELGTSSEALGYVGYVDVLHRWFTNNRNNNSARRMYGEAPEWRFKGHAEIPFWRWVTSWARAARRPSDLGYDDGDFQLPPLIEHEHEIESTAADEERLFTIAANNLHDQRRERRRSLPDRCEAAARIANETDGPVLVWCHLNDEGDMLERLIPGSVQVSGRDSDEEKEAKLLGFIDGDHPVLISKPRIAALGLNFQHCSTVVSFTTHSYEQHYQGVRRCWRYGQRNPVHSHIIYSPGERRVLENLQRKAAQADRMFQALTTEMRNAQKLHRTPRENTTTEVPTWLHQ